MSRKSTIENAGSRGRNFKTRLGIPGFENEIDYEIDGEDYEFSFTVYYHDSDDDDDDDDDDD